MEINKTKDSNTAVVRISGEIDTANVAEFEEKLREAVSEEAQVILDLEELEYVSSAGLRVFLMIQKMYGNGDALTIINTNEEVMDIFKVTGFVRLLNLK